MNLIKSVRAKLSGQTTEEFGFGHRSSLTKQMIEAIRTHFGNRLVSTDLASYNYERRHSDYADAKSDLVIYDGTEKAVFGGREFNDGRLVIWLN